LLPVLQKELRAGDILLVKGSHGSKMHELAKALLNKDSAMGKRHAV
jgi:UDP-N-acetylmuramyl pentapeptide synthase